MTKKIKIRAGSVEIEADLNESTTAEKVWDILPVRARANLWGDEIYFPIPLEAELQNPQEVVEKGDLGYWGQGNTFCIFFGPTPISSGDEIRPASEVDVIGKISGNPEEFKKVKLNEEVIIEKL